MVQITSALSLLLACSTVSVAAPIVARSATPKRVLAWDYSNGDDNKHINQANFGSSQMVGVLNWNTWTPPALTKTQYFQPTIRTMAQASGDEFGWAQTFAKANPGAIIHTFNEPELNGLSAKDAANAWNNILVPLRTATGCKLVSPAITNTDASVAWLNEFFGNIGGNAPDFLGLHFYDTVPQNLQGWLEARHSEHSYPIIVSEIASINPSESIMASTTKTWANYMDGADIVHQYAFFGAMSELPKDGGFFPASSLLIDNTGGFKPILTELINNAPMQ